MRAAERILVCDALVPAHDRDAGGLRMSWIIRLLNSLGCRVTLFPLDRRRREPYATEFERIGIEVHCGPESFRDLAQARPESYDIVIVSRPWVARALLNDVRHGFPRAVVIYDTVDLHFLRDYRGAKVENRPNMLDVLRRHRRRRRELRLVRESDWTIAVTEVEASIIKRWVPRARVVVLPTVHAPEPEPPPYDGREDLLFIGGFSHPPNVDAVDFFVREIHPLLRARIGARLHIVGPDPTTKVLNLRSRDVVVAGHVPDADPFFQQCRVFVSPLRYGAGMKGKNGQAMAFGLPMVTTSIGAEGMDLVDGRHALIRDDPRSFADGIVALYQSRPLWEGISENARNHAREHWTPEVMQTRLGRLLSLVGVNTSGDSEFRRPSSLLTGRG